MVIKLRYRPRDEARQDDEKNPQGAWRSDSEDYRGEGFRARYRRRIRRNATGLLPRLEHKRRGSMDREQIDVQIYLGSCLMNGISQQTRMVLAGDWMLRSLRRSVMLMTRRNRGSIRVRGRPCVAYQTCRHAVERGHDQQDRQYRDAFAQCVNHGFSLAEHLRGPNSGTKSARCANERKPRRRASSFLKREKMRRKPLSLRNSGSISLRFL